jgi:hypothetical protein
VLDFEADTARLPRADLTLLCNVLSYVSQPLDLLEAIAARSAGSAVAIRESGSLRFGPMPPEQHDTIETELQTRIAQRPFRHFDMDRTYAALASAPFAHREIGFELFERSAPFPSELDAYWDGTLWWTADNLSPTTAAALERWRAEHQPVGEKPAYIVEVDVVAVLRSR